MAVRRAGRYLLYDPIASGGMASVHLGRVIGPAGFSRTVAIKRLHPHLSTDPEFVAMFLDEARLAARIHHPNVVSTLDVVTEDGELLLVMDYVLGESWWNVLRTARAGSIRLPVNIVSSVICGLLHGLHAAHEARSETGEALQIVHRDISPQNIIVGADGVARVVDFGIAKAISRMHSTRNGEVKGKLNYMSPEQILTEPIDRRADVYAAGVVLWESLTGARLYKGEDAGATIHQVLQGKASPPSAFRPDIPGQLDELVLAAITVAPNRRPSTALDFAVALEAVVPPAPAHAVAAFISDIACDALTERRKLIAELEQTPSEGTEAAPPPASLPAALAASAERRALAAAETAVSVVGPSISPPAATLDRHLVSPTPTRRGSRSWVLVGGLALLTAGGMAASYVSSHRKANAEPSIASTPIVERSSSAVAASATVQPVPPDERSVSATPAASPPIASSTVPRRPGPRPRERSGQLGHPQDDETGHRTGNPTPTHVPTAASAQPGPDCNPNYTFDENGVKRFKPWCL